MPVAKTGEALREYQRVKKQEQRERYREERGLIDATVTIPIADAERLRKYAARLCAAAAARKDAAA